MNSEISIPHPLSDQAEELARKLGIPLADLYTAAVASYVAEHQREHVTETLDSIYQTEPSTVETALAGLQLASIGSEVW